MKIKPYLYGIFVLVIFFGIIGTAQAAGWWATSGQVDASGKPIVLDGTDVNNIKGWMTIGDVTESFKIPMDELIKAFELPAATTSKTPIPRPGERKIFCNDLTYLDYGAAKEVSKL